MSTVGANRSPTENKSIELVMSPKAKMLAKTIAVNAIDVCTSTAVTSGYVVCGVAIIGAFSSISATSMVVGAIGLSVLFATPPGWFVAGGLLGVFVSTAILYLAYKLCLTAVQIYIESKDTKPLIDQYLRLNANLTEVRFLGVDITKLPKDKDKTDKDKIFRAAITLLNFLTKPFRELTWVPRYLVLYIFFPKKLGVFHGGEKFSRVSCNYFFAHNQSAQENQLGVFQPYYEGGRNSESFYRNSENYSVISKDPENYSMIAEDLEERSISDFSESEIS